MSKEYAVYDIKEYEQCVFLGTIKEVANYLDYSVGSLRSYLTRRKNRTQDLLKHRYELVEVIEDEKEDSEKVSYKKDFFEEIIKEFKEEVPKFQEFNEFNWILKGLKDKVMGEEEQWKKIPQFDYSISNYGRVRNDKTGKTKKTRRKNYLVVVDLYKDGKRYTINIVRLEASLFVRPLLENEIVKHIDGDWRNNYYKNLKIVSK